MVRSLLTRIMELERYHVYTAADGLEALSLLENVPPVDIVITDLRMPRMGGQLLATELSKRHPQMPILLISGAYLGSFTGLTGPVLPKPFTAMTLISRVRELLAQREHPVRSQADPAGVSDNLVS
jgi:two-component system, cell cycle sensor histidine kinase and response regulator CckA